MHTIVYAHGFKSSSKSRKATQLSAHLKLHHPDIRYLAPDLSFRPTQAISQLQWHCLGKPPEKLTVVGSSLGGFYAVVLAEKLGCRAVLLNPSIRPFETLSKYLGEQTNIYTGEKFTFDESHIAELRALFVPTLMRMERYLLMVEMGDELLDHTRTIAYCQGAKQIVIEGGDHELKSFPRHLAEVVAFATAG
ncbi:MAG: esterase [Betaproteobacteria bacterium]|nr:esterase [Betaproteobacteria bacterium]